MFAKKSTITALTASLLLSASSGLALAQDAQTPPPPKPGANDAPCMPPRAAGMMMMHGPAGRFIVALQQFDTNKDGKISKDEAKAAEDAIFTAIDADKDGSLTPGEMRKYREARMEAWKAEMPKPPEGAPDAKDAPKPDDAQSADGGPQDMADAPDQDDDGMAPPPPPGDDACGPFGGPGMMGHHGPMGHGPDGKGPDGKGPDRMGGHDHKGPDRMGGHDRKGPDGHGPDGRDHGPRGPHGMMGDGPRGMGPHGMRGGMMGGMGPGMIQRLDTDENGQISKAEADAAVEALFDRFDTNKDGFISADDFPKAPSLLPDAK